MQFFYIISIITVVMSLGEQSLLNANESAHVKINSSTHYDRFCDSVKMLVQCLDSTQRQVKRWITPSSRH